MPNIHIKLLKLPTIVSGPLSVPIENEQFLGSQTSKIWGIVSSNEKS